MARVAISERIKPILFHNFVDRLREGATRWGLHPRNYGVANGIVELAARDSDRNLL